MSDPQQQQQQPAVIQHIDSFLGYNDSIFYCLKPKGLTTNSNCSFGVTYSQPIFWNMQTSVTEAMP